MNDALSTGRELEVQEKQEVASGEENTVQGRFYTPLTDIYESGDALFVVMEVPGVDKDDLEVQLEQDRLSVQARISLEPYSNMKPLYTEYGVGHFARSFRLSNTIDRDAISATITDGVLTLKLPKIEQAASRKIEVR